jgi:colicin import membrane protein
MKSALLLVGVASTFLLAIASTIASNRIAPDPSPAFAQDDNGEYEAEQARQRNEDSEQQERYQQEQEQQRMQQEREQNETQREQEEQRHQEEMDRLNSEHQGQN